MTEVFDKERQGTVLRIERSSIHDGDGFRTVVFLKGCPLRCQWCSTPESHSFEVEQIEEKCYGTRMTVDEVMREVRKDSLFFFISTGGITLSGGEVLSQPDFTYAILKSAQQECFNTAIETSFYAPWETVSRILAHVHTAFVDLKIMDPEKHRKYVGVDNKLIRSNLLATNEMEGRFRMVVRTPIIPGVNDSEEELEQLGAFCAKLRRVHHVQLLPYHRLGTETYKKMGRQYLLAAVQPPTAEHMERCREIVRRHVKHVI